MGKRNGGRVCIWAQWCKGILDKAICNGELKVTPLEIDKENGAVKVKVHQVVHDLNGRLLTDEIVYHFFHLRDNKVAQFDIGEKIGA